MAEKKKTIKTIQPTKTPIPHQPPDVRIKNFDEVALGYTESDALNEAVRDVHDVIDRDRAAKGLPAVVRD